MIKEFCPGNSFSERRGSSAIACIDAMHDFVQRFYHAKVALRDFQNTADVENRIGLWIHKIKNLDKQKKPGICQECGAVNRYFRQVLLRSSIR